MHLKWLICSIWQCGVELSYCDTYNRVRDPCMYEILNLLWQSYDWMVCIILNQFNSVIDIQKTAKVNMKQLYWGISWFNLFGYCNRASISKFYRTYGLLVFSLYLLFVSSKIKRKTWNRYVDSLKAVCRWQWRIIIFFVLRRSNAMWISEIFHMFCRQRTKQQTDSHRACER